MDASEDTALLEQDRLGKSTRPQYERTQGRHLDGNEQKTGEMHVGERLPYSDYYSIDFLHDRVSRHNRRVR